jgi:hypothetical protein
LDDSDDKNSDDDDGEAKDKYVAPDTKNEEDIEQQDGQSSQWHQISISKHDNSSIYCQKSLWCYIDLLCLYEFFLHLHHQVLSLFHGASTSRSIQISNFMLLT